ncbi:MAG: UDP-4-amino-4,6-dideoxy-N-acetyl-beta-L-altrosamine N-acetyltransferase [Treponema sp.]|nr:UDP-4-amino-4,6-dideoxy-N-acetyl-beta-L-altrosamine N-acetyltransferase [Treponema sp.]
MKLTFKNFTELTEQEIELIWSMRNSTRVRTKMYNQEIVPLEQHKKWVAMLKNRTDCRYFLSFVDNTILGVVDFTAISEIECEWGYYLDEKYLNSGYGVVLEYYALKYAFETLHVNKLCCAVLESNSNVYDAHIKYFGFTVDEKYSSTKESKHGVLHFNGLSLLKADWQKWKNPFVERSLKFFRVAGVEWI